MTQPKSNTQGKAPVVKAIVVASDVTRQQNTDAIIKRRASL
jgi:hypothetical protein